MAHNSIQLMLFRRSYGHFENLSKGPYRTDSRDIPLRYLYIPMPDSNKLRFKYLSHGSLHEGPPKVYQDPGLPLIEARDSCFSSKIWAKFRIESIRGRWDCTKFWVGITGLKNLIRDPPSRHMPREMIACNKAFPFFGEEQQATGKIAYEEGVKIGSFRGRSIFIAGGGGF